MKDTWKNSLKNYGNDFPKKGLHSYVMYYHHFLREVMPSIFKCFFLVRVVEGTVGAKQLVHANGCCNKMHVKLRLVRRGFYEWIKKIKMYKFETIDKSIVCIYIYASIYICNMYKLLMLLLLITLLTLENYWYSEIENLSIA